MREILQVHPVQILFAYVRTMDVFAGRAAAGCMVAILAKLDHPSMCLVKCVMLTQTWVKLI